MTDRPTIGITDYATPRSETKVRLYERVRSWADLRLLDPETEHPDLPEMGLDLYHMARWTPQSLRDLRRACEAGLPTVNSHEGAATTEDRLVRTQRIEDAGITVPPYAFGPADEVTLAPPVVVKTRHELAPGGHAFSVVFAGPLEYEGERFVQRYVAPRRSYKVFGVGEHVRTTRHAVGSDVSREWRETARETPTSSVVAELVETVGSLFELALFELDLVVHKGHYVIDVNPVVSLDGVADGVDIYEALLRRTAGLASAASDPGGGDLP